MKLAFNHANQSVSKENYKNETKSNCLASLDLSADSYMEWFCQIDSDLSAHSKITARHVQKRRQFSLSKKNNIFRWSL